MNRGDLSFLETMFKKSVEEITTNLLIVNQTKGSKVVSDFENIKVINVNEIGLSKSRNLAIENSTKDLCWIMDDDCTIIPDAIEKIVAAHNDYEDVMLTFKTQTPTGESFYDYRGQFFEHDRKSIVTVLSPEITFKRNMIIDNELRYDTRFGLGAQFQDSENFVFLSEVLKNGLRMIFVPEAIVQHEAVTSSDEVASNRVIYARGALAAYSKQNITFRKWKYGFFLLRKGLVKHIRVVFEKMKIFKKGAIDFKTLSN